MPFIYEELCFCFLNAVTFWKIHFSWFVCLFLFSLCQSLFPLKCVFLHVFVSFLLEGFLETPWSSALILKQSAKTLGTWAGLVFIVRSGRCIFGDPRCQDF